MPYPTVGHRLPRPVASRLFGDRRRFGTVVRADDPHWREWLEVQVAFYDEVQKRSVGKVVNDAGYRVLRTLDFSGKSVFEIGPGELGHLPQWSGLPARYVGVDVSRALLERAAGLLAERGVAAEMVLVGRETARVPFADGEFDVVVSFYSLEHLQPLSAHVSELVRILRPGGILVGAIPAEGGLAWGLGRLLTGRRWLKKHTGIDPDKIICWEHPNFAATVLRTLDGALLSRTKSYWPLGLPSIDLNLVVRFLYEKR